VVSAAQARCRFTDPLMMQSAVSGAEQFFVNDQMTWLARGHVSQ
jgi:hypothetical protein